MKAPFIASSAVMGAFMYWGEGLPESRHTAA
ncbi:hypothetical protein SAMN04489731_108255 [Amycolatopsis regifaucium]|nr:hypothetical protein SAMN04489731_108255 [Amycolatopsis regifaucium]